MCGRFSQAISKEKLKRKHGLELDGPETSRYNVAPTQMVYVLGSEQKSLLIPQRWGLIPHWANNESVGNHLINARAEDIAGKPSFRMPIRHTRCLIPMDSFYEWQVRASGVKQPYRIYLPDNELMFVAGIWDRWIKPGGKEIHSFAILTTDANKEMSEVHNRMPVIFTSSQDREKWLDNIPLPDVLSMLKPLPDDSLLMYTISEMVNSPKNDSAEIQKEYTPPPRLTLFD